MRTIFLVSLIAGWAAVAATPAHAVGDPDAVAGLIAERCANCHRVPEYPHKFERPDLNAPSFEEIAADPRTYPPERMRTFLTRPHWPMTQFVLSHKDIDDILAYIDRMR